jgi:hypothetical protein
LVLPLSIREADGDYAAYLILGWQATAGRRSHTKWLGPVAKSHTLVEASLEFACQLAFEGGGAQTRPTKFSPYKGSGAALIKEEEMKTFLIIFWIHQAIFGLSSLGAVLNLLLEGGATNQSNLVPLLLAMIAGSLTWGFGFVMAERLRSWASQA